MWPNGHDQFCQTVVHMIKQLDELKDMIELMILGSYGLGEKLNSIMDLNFKPRMDNGSSFLYLLTPLYLLLEILLWHGAMGECIQ
ncbi:hypothetical protein ABKV19_004610 [Rosa sericea]